jgi:hypothetical protein
MGAVVRTISFAVFFLVATGLRGEPQVSPPAPTDVIVVEFQDGRRVMGELAGIESDQRLWLIQREAGIELRSGYEWSQVKSVILQGRPVSLDFLRKQQRSQTPPWKSPDEAVPFSEVSFPPVSTPLPPLSESQAVTLEIFAEPANWNADPQVDGLHLYLTPRDRFGRPVKVGGELSVVLESRRLGPGPIRQRGDRAPRVELQRWGLSISGEDYGPEGVLVRLPFQGRRQQNLNGLGVPFTLDVRLGIPGQTVLEAVTGISVGSPHF